jgi:DGQHR domain-containing protein
MQRGLAKRRVLQELVPYLEESDHFFSAVTLIILPRDLDRPAVLADPDEDEDDDWDYAFERAEKKRPGRQRHGVLRLSGDVVLFPADGQHRLAAEFAAMEETPELSKEELPVVFLPYDSPEQVRQLFSDLNLNAKPVSKTIGIAYETRNPMVLVVKAAADRVDLFSGRVNRRTNSLSKSSTNVITLNTLHEGTKAIAEGLATAAGTPLDEYIADQDMAATEIAGVWNEIVDAFSDYWQKVQDGSLSAGELREQYLFPHGLGWNGLAKAAGALISEHRGAWVGHFQKGVHALSWERTAPEWSGNAVIHDTAKGTNRVNNTGPAINQLRDTIIDKANKR